MDESTERRVREVREELHAIGFPADDLADEVLAGSLVLIHRGKRWEVVEGFRVLSIIESTERADVTSAADMWLARAVSRRYVHVLLVGNNLEIENWPSGPSHVFAFDEWGFYLGHLEIEEIRGTGTPQELRVDVEMQSVGHYRIDVWGDRPG